LMTIPQNVKTKEVHIPGKKKKKLAKWKVDWQSEKWTFLKM
jgi:hypothetical protein